MCKVFMSLLLVLFAAGNCFAGTDDQTFPATTAVSITDATANKSQSRAVWVGTTQSLDFSFDGTTWVTFQGATAGTVIPIRAVGARKTSGAAAPTAGDIVFLY